MDKKRQLGRRTLAHVPCALVQQLMPSRNHGCNKITLY